MSGLVISFGLIVLVGWAIDLEPLKKVLLDGTPMKPNVALCFITLGTALWCTTAARAATGAAPRMVVAILVGITLATTVATLVEYATSTSWGIDQMLFVEHPGPTASLPAGRMSPYSAFCFAAAALLTFVQSRPRHPRYYAPAAGAVGTLIIAISLLSVGVHFTNLALGLRWWGTPAMAVHTSLCFTAIGTALIGFAFSEYQLQWTLGRGTTALLVASVLVLLGLNAFVHYASGEMLNSSRWAAHAQEVRFRNSQVLVGLQTVQLGQRGFVITGRPAFLQEAAAGQRRSEEAIAALRELTADNPSQKPRIDLLKSLFDENLRVARGVEMLQQLQGREAAIAQMSPGNALFLAGRMETVSHEIDQEEARLAGEREAAALRIYNRHFMALPIGTFVSLLLISFGLFTLNRHASERRQAEQALRESEERFRTTFENLMEGCQIIGFDWRYLYVNAVAAQHGGKPVGELVGHRMTEVYPAIGQTKMFGVLERCMRERSSAQIETEFAVGPEAVLWFELVIQPVPEGLFILSLDITQKKHAEEAIQHLNADLERRVLSRTAELDSANRELEAFSYSVSHDLRAPLRGIDGFARVLKEDYSAVLGQEGQRVLDIIGGETKRMGELIDDLLRFSRISRQALQQAPVDMAFLAQNVIDELIRQYPAHATGVRLQALPEVVGDRAMLRQVWFNLIGNALKFSSRQSAPVVDIGCQRDGDFLVFHVRDNGVGFDERYLAKLFNVFQRLHTETEFEGTGVGLALVSRIITRHGGRVWAEGRPNQGATFRFRLPVPESLPA